MRRRTCRSQLGKRLGHLFYERITQNICCYLKHVQILVCQRLIHVLLSLVYFPQEILIFFKIFLKLIFLTFVCVVEQRTSPDNKIISPSWDNNLHFIIAFGVCVLKSNVGYRPYHTCVSISCLRDNSGAVLILSNKKTGKLINWEKT